MKICVCRNPGSESCTEIDLNKISGFKWQNVSGGRRIYTGSKYYLYGYVDYNWAAEFLDECSGSHGNIAYSAKVMIPDWANKENPKYKLTYKYLMLKYPKTSYSRNTTAKKIFDYLEANGKTSRSDLLNTILEKTGKTKATVNKAIKNLYDEGIVCSDLDKGQERNYWLFTQD